MYGVEIEDTPKKKGGEVSGIKKKQQCEKNKKEILLINIRLELGATKCFTVPCQTRK